MGAYWIHLVRPPVCPSVCRRLGFRSVTLVCFIISISKFISIFFVAMGRSLFIFSDVTFNMAAWRPSWIFRFPDLNFSFVLNIQASTEYPNFNSPNFTGTARVCMRRSLLIFSNITFKMGAWRPYWIFQFRSPTSVWLWISSPNFSSKLPLYMGRCLLIFSKVTSKTAT